MRARREFEAGNAVLRRGKVINRPVITKLWVNGRASDGLTANAVTTTKRKPEVQAERILSQRRRSDHCVALGRRVAITVDTVLRARGKMLRNKANGAADCRVTELLQCLSTETVYEVTHWFDNRFRGECRALEAWKVLRFVFLKQT